MDAYSDELGPTTACDDNRGMTFTRLGASALFAGGQVLSDGASAVVSGTPVRLATSGGSVMIGNQLYGIGPHRDYHENSNDPAGGASVTPTPRVISAGGVIYTANADGDYIIHGQTLSRGEKIVDAGTTISLATDGAFALVGSSIQELSPKSTGTAHVISFKGHTYIADPDSNFVIDGQTLHPGSRLTISGTVISLATDGSFAIIGSSTQSLSPLPTDPPVITFHGKPIPQAPPEHSPSMAKPFTLETKSPSPTPSYLSLQTTPLPSLAPAHNSSTTTTHPTPHQVY